MTGNLRTEFCIPYTRELIAQLVELKASGQVKNRGVLLYSLVCNVAVCLRFKSKCSHILRRASENTMLCHVEITKTKSSIVLLRSFSYQFQLLIMWELMLYIVYVSL